ncbi:helix-turn-helix transcriptional regulator [Streptomyces avermitilis]|uniref:helix-turn-helix domain-containing protein n=1 Tax=Streptomyces avermitilis TaxID=33903 RepID=UPI0033BEFE02
MTAVEDFARYLVQLHARAGSPSRRDLAGRTGYGKSSISDAFAGRHLPTWPLVEKLVGVLGGEAGEARERWAAAKGGPSLQEVPDWLTSVRSDFPELITGVSFVDACTLAAADPKQAMASAWEVLRLSGLQLSHAFYGDIPGIWSSDVVSTFRRAEEDGRLPVGVAAAANAVHYHHVRANFPDETLAPADVLQAVFLAYRLAWQAWDVLTAANE